LPLEDVTLEVDKRRARDLDAGLHHPGDRDPGTESREQASGRKADAVRASTPGDKGVA
jgi:hypothetical protein